MKPLILAGPGENERARDLASLAGADLAEVTIRAFPDSEVYVRIDSPVQGRAVNVLCTLHPVQEKALPLFLLAATARDLGAARVDLVAPYLAYLRHDSRFRAGEGLTSAYFANLLGGLFDSLITIDPHLHRYRSLGEVYAIPSRAVSAARRIAEWVSREIERPVVVGPDAESAQWAGAVASAVGCRAVILDKVRRGDRDVSVSQPRGEDRAALAAGTPVLVDDIISTGHTMVEALRQLRAVGGRPPICLGVHAVFADDAHRELLDAGAARVVTCNTIEHPTNHIDILDLLAGALADPSA